MKYLLALDSLDYKPSGMHTAEFAKQATELAQRKKHQWEGNVKAIICDDLQAGMRALRNSVRDWLLGSWWFKPELATSITVRGVFSEIDDNGRLWWIPTSSSSDTEIPLYEEGHTVVYACSSYQRNMEDFIGKRVASFEELFRLMSTGDTLITQTGETYHKVQFRNSDRSPQVEVADLAYVYKCAYGYKEGSCVKCDKVEEGIYGVGFKGRVSEKDLRSLIREYFEGIDFRTRAIQGLAALGNTPWARRQV